MKDKTRAWRKRYKRLEKMLASVIGQTGDLRDKDMSKWFKKFNKKRTKNLKREKRRRKKKREKKKIKKRRTAAMEKLTPAERVILGLG